MQERREALVVVRDESGGGCWDGVGLALAMGVPLSGLVLALAARDAEEKAGELCQRSGLDVLPLALSGDGPVNAAALAGPLEEAVKSLGCGLVLFGPGPFAMEAAPYLAARLSAALLPGVSSAAADPLGGYRFLRPVMNGKLDLPLRVDAPLLVVAAASGAFSWELPEEAPPGRVLAPAGPVPEGRVRWRPAEEAAPDPGLGQADVIVAAGRGVGSEENMALIRETAGLFARSAVAGSRGACDASLVPVSHQVGMTGKSVAPRLYMACGISGARQHVCGMSGAGFVVGVNRDPAAPIFRASDICISEDLTLFLPELVRACREERGE